MGGCMSSSNSVSEKKLKENLQQKVSVSKPDDDVDKEITVVKEVLSEAPRILLTAAEQDSIDDSSHKPKRSVDNDEEVAYQIYSVKDEEGEKEKRSSFAGSPAKPQRKRSMSGDFHSGSAGGIPSSPCHVKRAEGAANLQRSFSGIDKGGHLHRQDSCGASKKRPGSPASMTGNGVSRTSSLRGTGQDSLGRDPPPPGYVDGGGAWRAHLENEEATRGKESLENPLVSLECFIFL